MGREYTSASKRAKAPDLPAGELPGPEAPAGAVLAWTGKDRQRVRQALAAEQAYPEPRLELVDALERLLAYFTLDGVRFVAESDEVTVLDLSELARMYNVDADSPEGVAALADFFEAVLGKATYRRFRRHCREYHTSEDTLVDIMGELVEELTDRPTQPSSASAPGPGTTGPTSRVVSFSRGQVRPMSREEFTAWRAREQEAQQQLGERTQQLLDQQVPTPTGFTPATPPEYSSYG